MSGDTCDLLCLDVPKAEALRHRRLGLDAAEAAAARAKALADPTRLMLAVALRDAEGELCVCDLSWVAERSEKLVSHHVRALRAVGLGRSRRDGKMVMYALTDTGRALVDSVLAEHKAVAS
jgi:ArsR family transcriptional regulator, lead/cadmium/zinc/bismuth-responsive transcriptional repressor